MGNWFVDPSIWPFLISAAMLVFIVLVFLSVWYRIDGDRLIVHQGFWSKDYPIDKIKEIKRVHLYQSAPATSVVHRIGISFTDRSILKSSTPLIISPTRQQQFIAELKGINPGIIVDNELKNTEEKRKNQ